MNKFFYFYNSLCTGSNTPTAFSFDPYILAIKDMLVSELQQIVYYIEKLKNLNIDMSEYRDKVIDFIAILIVNLDFRKESFFIIVEDLYNNKKKLEDMYIEACNKSGIEPGLLVMDKINLNSKESIIKALNKPKKDELTNNINKDNKILYDLMINIVLNACNCLIELKNFGIDFIDAKEEVLCLLNTPNEQSENDENLKEKIISFAACNYKIVKMLNSTIVNKFGPVEETMVNLSAKKGKAILVSGNSFLDLEKILIAAQDTDINVYTHNEMLSAHEYKNLKTYKNLAGHYQVAYSNFSLEFAQFPGPIYISQNSVPKIDVIRGQIYTSARYPSYGIAKVENDDFTPIIQYALKSKGFKEESSFNTVRIGYYGELIQDKIMEISNMINLHEIKHIFIIGLIDMFNIKNEYIFKFIKECPSDCYIISFGYDSIRENFWHVNSYYDFSILYDIVEKLQEKVDDFENNVSIFLSECTPSTISHIFNLIHLKLKKIFLGQCCPNMINPLIIEGMSKLFGIESLESPKKDILKAIKEEEG